MKNKRPIGRQLICVMFFTSLLGPALSVFAQAGKKPAGPKCSGAWTGNITISRTQRLTDTKVTPRVSARGKDTRELEMKLDYKASIAVVEAPERNGSNIGRATVNSAFSSTEKTLAQEENSCDRGKSFQVMTGNFTSRSEINGDGMADASVSIGVNSDGTYSVGVGVSQIPGKTGGLQTASYSGQCSPKEGYNIASPSTPTTVQGVSIHSNGTNHIDPSNPNQISGSFSQTNLGITDTITWSLQKCGAPLRISDLQFEDMRFPTWNEWQEITEQKGTIDGNFVKIKAKVLNTSGDTKYATVRFKETYKGDKWDGAKPDAPLNDQEISVSVPAGEEKNVEIVWDSSGYAWFDDGRPRLLQRIKAELDEDNKKIDEKTENLKIAPKPVVLVHGLWSSWEAWNTWQNIFTTSHSYDWKAFPVGEKPGHGVMNTGKTFMSSEQTASIGDNAHALDSYVRYAQEHRNAWHVDIVAHSMGGLISRWYIDQLMQTYREEPRPRVSHLVMLGTPNMGSPCAEVMDIAFGMIGKQVEAVRQLQPDYVAGFNKIHTNRKGVKFSSLAGNPLPVMCQKIVPNDGVVSVPSAHWTIKDTGISASLHTDLTGTKDFSDFVKPRLAIGPKGFHNPDTFYLMEKNAVMPGGAYALNASRGPNGASEIPIEYVPENYLASQIKPDFAKDVKVAAKQSVDIEIPVETASNFGLTFMADPQISATLINDKGEIVGKNMARSPESRGWFRSIFFDGPTTAAGWKLRIENTGDREFEIVVATWKNAR